MTGLHKKKFKCPVPIKNNNNKTISVYKNKSLMIVSFLEGKAQNIKLEGFVARIFLHEFDHLIGKTWLDHISSTENIMANDVWMAKFA